jgi:two-component system, chemotaxis family, sensor kinase CheA
MAQDIDLSQFHAIFFEECSEGIEAMESGLINLGVGETDTEMINTIFRAAHSIKGGAGTFGFNDISEFTHGMETMLDEMREGRRSVTKEAITLLLESVDCLKHMVQCCKDDKAIDFDAVTALAQQLASLPAENIGTDTDDKKVDTETSIDEEKQTSSFGWNISFYPYENLFYSGNDPLRILRELHDLGELEVQIDASGLPDFADLEPEKSYLGWKILLIGDANKEQVSEVFAWVEGDCKLEIEAKIDRRAQRDRRADDKVTGTFGRRLSDREPLIGQEATTIRVGVDKVDDLINLVGELVITQSILNRVCLDLGLEDAEKLDESLEQLERNTRDLQEQTMNIRMLPIDFAFQRLPRIVRDLSQTLNKKVELKFSGQTTELDKTVLEKIGDPLVHLVRNSLDHAIEMPDQRRAAGKDETGTINVNAYHQGGNIIIEVIDDGAGLDLDKIFTKAKEKGLIEEGDTLSALQIQDMIFQPGFSTAATVSDVSGRGVGMDVVRSNIEDLGGAVEVYSEAGKGSTFTIRLPLTLAILEGQMVRVGEQIYILPLLAIVESVQVKQGQVNAVAGKDEFYQYRDEYLPVLRLHKIFNVETKVTNLEQGLLVIIDAGGERVGLYVEDVVGQQQVVIKSLKKNFRQIQGLAGATILGDGSVALILDLAGLIQHQSGHITEREIIKTNSVLH